MRGPEFLALYIVLSTAVYIGLRVAIGGRESEPGSRTPHVRDPYTIAYLTGGTSQLVQVTALSLIRRKLLDVRAGELHARDGDAATAVTAPIERVLLESCQSARSAALLDRQASIQAVAESYRVALADSGLVPSDEMRSARKRLTRAAILALAALAAVKILYALATGHQNVAFLVLLAALAAIAISSIARDHRTRLGNETLQNLRTLFARVKREPRPLGPDQHHEALLLAAVFSDFAVPDMDPAAWRTLFPRAKDKKTGGGDGDSGCGSSCGSGCGGGGGCGGCGS
jgi:uncharacterized protein (TIGR04222 family)